MANLNNIPDTQLARIVAPNISDPTYASKLSDSFEIINENFRKMASAPFLQGVKGDSYQLQSYPIWWNDGTVWKLTEEGAILLNSIFPVTNKYRFTTNKTFTSCKNIANTLAPIIGTHSAIDCFDDGNGGMTNNTVYFQEIIDDANLQVIGSRTYGQLFYFVDGRLKDAGTALENSTYKIALEQYCDLSGFYQYDNSDPTNPKYVKLELMPAIYYDSEQDSICWAFNGVKTGISAVGATGKAGKDAVLKYVKISASNKSAITSSTNNPVIAVAKIKNTEIKWYDDFTTIDEYLEDEDNVLIFIEYPVEYTDQTTNNTVQTADVSYEYAFGKVYKSGGEWKVAFDPMGIIENGVTFTAINDYLRNLGYYANMYAQDVDTPLRQYIEIPISPKISADLGTHKIGTCYKKTSPVDSNNGSLIIHRNQTDTEHTLEKNVILSGYENLLIKNHALNPSNGLVSEVSSSPSIEISTESKTIDSTAYSPTITMKSPNVNGSTQIRTKYSTGDVEITAHGTINLLKNTLIGSSTLRTNGTATFGDNVEIKGNKLSIGNAGNSHVKIKSVNNASSHFEIDVPQHVFIFNDTWDGTKKANLYVHDDIETKNGSISSAKNIQAQNNIKTVSGYIDSGSYVQAKGNVITKSSCVTADHLKFGKNNAGTYWHFLGVAGKNQSVDSDQFGGTDSLLKVHSEAVQFLGNTQDSSKKTSVLVDGKLTVSAEANFNDTVKTNYGLKLKTGDFPRTFMLDTGDQQSFNVPGDYTYNREIVFTLNKSYVVFKEGGSTSWTSGGDCNLYIRQGNNLKAGQFFMIVNNTGKKLYIQNYGNNSKIMRSVPIPDWGAVIGYWTGSTFTFNGNPYIECRYIQMYL